MTEKTDFPELPEVPEEGQSEAAPDASLESHHSMDDMPPVPETPPEPKYLPFDYVAPEAIVQKMQDLIHQRKEEAAERERLASMPKQPYRREEPRVGRNDPCPCGSGKKYKKCHMGKDLDDAAASD